VPSFDLDMAKQRWGITRRLTGAVSSGAFDRLTRASRRHLPPSPSPHRVAQSAVDVPLSATAMLGLLASHTPVAPTTPLTHAEAMRDVNREAWADAIAAELGSMDDFGVWELVPPPPGVVPLGNRWIFKIKRDKHGLVERLKARLTLQGFRMREGRDYDEVWAPTGRLRTFRALMAEASSGSYRTAQWDCTSAFLHAYLDKEVYIRQAPGTAKPGQEHYVCRLIKAIYGTKQASRLFGELVESTLISFNDEAAGIVVTKSAADDCLFLVHRGEESMRILTHIDDFAVTFNSQPLYDHVFSRMQSVFKITDYGQAPITFYCGLAVHRAEDGSYELSQSSYIREVLARFGMSSCKPADSPERTGAKSKLRPLSEPLSAADAAFMKLVPYREAVGAVWYIARATRFDIFRATQEVARFVANPGPEHWAAVERLLRYLSKTADKPLVYRPASFASPSLQAHGLDARLVSHSDSDWAGDPDTSRSRTGWIVHFGGCLVAWRSVIQSSVAQSSCEAEYIAAGAAANELVWWRQLCADLGYPMRGASPVRCDSEAAVGLAKHSGKFEATKHIRLKYHVLRQYQKEGEVQTVWCPSRHQWADVLTKNVAVKDFVRITGLVMGRQHIAGGPASVA
jgi:hypothetical protein